MARTKESSPVDDDVSMGDAPTPTPAAAAAAPEQTNENEDQVLAERAAVQNVRVVRDFPLRYGTGRMPE